MNDKALTVAGFAAMVAGGDAGSLAAIKANIEKTIEYLGLIGVGETQALVMLDLFYQTGFLSHELRIAMEWLAETVSET